MTIAQQLKVTKFPFEINDSKGNRIYFENSTGFWTKREYDSDSNVIYYENSHGFWYKQEYDSNGSRIYIEDSHGCIKDNRPKDVELTLEEIAKKFGIKVENVRIKD